MSVLLLICIGGILILRFVFFVYKRHHRPTSFPPGPIPWPIIGNLHQAGLETHKTFIQLGEQYGKIFAFNFGSYRSIVINDLKLLKQCLNDPLCSGRPKFRFFLERSDGPGSTFCRGISVSEGQHWSEQKKFMIKNLRDFGIGKNTMEYIIHEEVVECIESLQNEIGKSISTKARFNAAIVNTLWRIVAGNKIPQSDPKFQTLLDLVYNCISNIAIMCIFFPTLTKWFPKLTGFADAMAHTKPMDAFIHGAYNKHKESCIPDNPLDLMDTVVDKITSTIDPYSSFYGAEGMKNVSKSLADLVIAGSESTSTTLEWFCLIMALNMEAQEKAFQEINKIIGKSKYPKLSDRPNMPYLECVILETLRISSVIPFALHHNAMEDLQLANYMIPKDTVIIPNLYAVHNSKEIWGDPETFRPERFLLADGTPNKTHEALLAFAPGKRFCLGEKLAKDELFLFTSSLLQQFRIETNPLLPLPTMKSRLSLALYPTPHQLILRQRE